MPPLPAAPDYAFGVRLDPGPRPLADIEPDYPDMATCARASSSCAC